MKYRLLVFRLLLSLLFLLTSFVSQRLAWAQETTDTLKLSIGAAPPLISDPHIKYHGDRKNFVYDGYSVAGALLRSALSTFILPNNSQMNRLWLPPQSQYQKEVRETFRIQYPWLFEYRYRTQGIPRYVAINKWTKPVRISFGLPNDMEPLPLSKGINRKEEFIQFTTSRYDSFPADLWAKVENEVASLIPALQDMTGLSISFVPYEKEKAPDFSELRIVLVHGSKSWHTPFKHGEVASPSNSFVMALYRGFQQTAVTFTPDMPYQVEGYIFPNAKNEIGMAICFISDEHEESLVKALVRECMVRSMGLPANSAGFGITGPWNNPKSKLELRLKNSQITIWEKYLLKLLYHPAVKPGMDANEVWQVLLGE